MLEANPNITDEVLETISNGTRKYFYLATIGGIFILSIFLGFVISLVSGLIMKKSPERDY